MFNSIVASGSAADSDIDSGTAERTQMQKCISHPGKTWCQPLPRVWLEFRREK